MRTNRTTQRRRFLQAVTCLAMLLTLAGTVTAQDAEPDWNRSVLPIPQPQFKGKAGLRTSEAVLDFPAEVTAPKGAPNILLIMPDDVGFGATAPFGGRFLRPHLSQLPTLGCVTTSSTRQHCARRPARRSSPAATITPSLPA